jgi:hypothetical protein
MGRTTPIEAWYHNAQGIFLNEKSSTDSYEARQGVRFSPASTIRFTITFQGPDSDFNGAINIVLATT